MSRKKIFLFNMGIIAVLGVLSILMIYPFFRLHQIGVLSDWAFHSSRVEQIYRNLKAGHVFTYIATSTFGSVGTGTFLFYPTVLLYPWAMFRFVLSPINAYFMFLMLFFWITLLVSYFSMIRLTKNRQRSFIFSILYTIAPYHLYLGITNNVLGEFMAYSFLPLVFLAFYEIVWQQKDSWKALAIGMTLVLYCHLVSVVIICEFLILFLILYFLLNKGMNKKQVFSLLKAMMTTIALNLFIVVPFITDYIGKNITSPTQGIIILYNANEILTQSLNNSATNVGGLGIVLLGVLIFGFIFTKNRSMERGVYYCGVFSLIMVTSLIPWHMVANTPLSVIQFPYRYFPYAILFLSVTGSYVFDNWIAGWQLMQFSDWISNFIKALFIITCSLFLYFGSIASDLQRNSNTNSDDYLQKLGKGKLATSYNATTPTILNNDNWNYQFDYMVLYGEKDYYPSAAKKHVSDILKHVAYVNDIKEIISPSTSANQLRYKIKVKKESFVDLPALAYTNSTVKIDGKNHEYGVSNRGTIDVNVKKGMHVVTIGYQPSMAFFISCIIASCTWILLIIVEFYKRIL